MCSNFRSGKVLLDVSKILRKYICMSSLKFMCRIHIFDLGGLWRARTKRVNVGIVAILPDNWQLDSKLLKKTNVRRFFYCFFFNNQHSLVQKFLSIFCLVTYFSFQLSFAKIVPVSMPFETYAISHHQNTLSSLPDDH